MGKRYPHIFVKDIHESTSFVSPRGGGNKITLPSVDRMAHAARLTQQWDAVWEEADRREKRAVALSVPAQGGICVEFEGFPGFPLVTKAQIPAGRGTITKCPFFILKR
jgi:hypothetical protein